MIHLEDLRLRSRLCGALFLLVVLVCACTADQSRTYANRAAERMREVCLKRPEICKEGLLVPNLVASVPHEQPWWLALQVQRFKCFASTDRDGNPELQVVAYIRNAGNQDITFASGIPLTLSGAAFTGDGQHLQLTDFETKPFATPITFHAPSRNPNLDPNDPQTWWVFDDQRTTIEFPVTRLRGAVTQVVVRLFVALQTATGFQQWPASVLYWPGVTDSQLVSAMPIVAASLATTPSNSALCSVSL
jgi:hypothetical protein